MLREINDKKEWDELVLKDPPKSGGFLLSWEWGESQARFGRPARRFASGHLCAQAIEHSLPFGKKYWFLPRGPWLPGIEDVAKRCGALFVRFEPRTEEALLPGARRTIRINTARTLVLDLTPSEEDLYSHMHKKNRYNVRIAQKHNIKTENLSDIDDQSFEEFYALMRDTSKRNKFRIHPYNYYKEMTKIPFVELWRATWEGKTLASGLWAYFGDTITYLHGGSSSEHRQVMAPYGLHWDIIKDAKARGMKGYDFWGLTEGPHDNLQGVTRFKMRFGGEVVEYPGTFDVPTNEAWYAVYKIIRRVRRLSHDIRRRLAKKPLDELDRGGQS